MFRKSVRLIAIGWLALPGCGGAPAGPETSEVTGVVTFKGDPVEGADVLFQPIQSGGETLACQAATDAEGRFAMSTHIGSGEYKTGMVPGEYAVSITKLDTSKVTSTLTPPKNVLPEKYASPRTSGFTATVSSSNENHFEFPLE
jgi:hypothetical protein